MIIRTCNYTRVVLCTILLLNIYLFDLVIRWCHIRPVTMSIPSCVILVVDVLVTMKCIGRFVYVTHCLFHVRSCSLSKCRLVSIFSFDYIHCSIVFFRKPSCPYWFKTRFFDHRSIVVLIANTETLFISAKQQIYDIQ